jgi:hypothetical protein
VFTSAIYNALKQKQALTPIELKAKLDAELRKYQQTVTIETTSAEMLKESLFLPAHIFAETEQGTAADENWQELEEPEGNAPVQTGNGYPAEQAQPSAPSTAAKPTMPSEFDEGPAQPGKPGYGGQQTGSGYAAQPEEPAYGGQQTVPGYAGQPTKSGYGAQQTKPGYGGQQTGPDYAYEQTKPGYGGQQTGPGYTAHPTKPGYGAQQTTPSYPAQSGKPGYGGQQTGPGYSGHPTKPGYAYDTTKPSYGGQQTGPAYTAHPTTPAHPGSAWNAEVAAGASWKPGKQTTPSAPPKGKSGPPGHGGYQQPIVTLLKDGKKTELHRYFHKVGTDCTLEFHVIATTLEQNGKKPVITHVVEIKRTDNRTGQVTTTVHQYGDEIAWHAAKSKWNSGDVMGAPPIVPPHYAKQQSTQKPYGSVYHEGASFSGEALNWESLPSYLLTAEEKEKIHALHGVKVMPTPTHTTEEFLNATKKIYSKFATSNMTYGYWYLGH